MPVACAALEEDGPGCPREQTCSTIEVGAGLDTVIEDYVDGVALSSLVDARATVV